MRQGNSGRQDSVQAAQIGLCLRWSHSIGEAAKGLQVQHGPWIEGVVGLVRNRNQELRVRIGKMHAGGHDADDAARYAVDAHGTAEDSGLRGVALPPISVAQDNVVILPGNGVVGREEIAQSGLNTEGVECVHRDRCAENAVGCVGLGDVGLDVITKSGDGREGLGVRAKRANPALGKDRRRAAGDAHQAVLVCEGQRTQQNGIDENIDDGVGADAQGQCEHSGERKARRIAHLAEREVNIFARRSRPAAPVARSR